MPGRTERLASSYRDSIHDSVSENRIDEALSTLQDLVSNLAPDLRNDVLILRRQYAQFRQDTVRNVASPGGVDVIVGRLLGLVSEVEKSPTIVPKFSLPDAITNNSHSTGPRASLRLVPASDEDGKCSTYMTDIDTKTQFLQ